MQLCVAGEDEDAHEELEGADAELAEEQVVKALPSGSAAKFWEGVLKETHQQLLQEEEQQVQHWHSTHAHHAGTPPPLDPAGAWFLDTTC